jgi:hypothetical protein
MVGLAKDRLKPVSGWLGSSPRAPSFSHCAGGAGSRAKRAPTKRWLEFLGRNAGGSKTRPQPPGHGSNLGNPLGNPDTQSSRPSLAPAISECLERLGHLRMRLRRKALRERRWLLPGGRRLLAVPATAHVRMPGNRYDSPASTQKCPPRAVIAVAEVMVDAADLEVEGYLIIFRSPSPPPHPPSGANPFPATLKRPRRQSSDSLRSGVLTLMTFPSALRK